MSTEKEEFKVGDMVVFSNSCYPNTPEWLSEGMVGRVIEIRTTHNRHNWQYLSVQFDIDKIAKLYSGELKKLNTTLEIDDSMVTDIITNLEFNKKEEITEIERKIEMLKANMIKNYENEKEINKMDCKDILKRYYRNMNNCLCEERDKAIKEIVDKDLVSIELDKCNEKIMKLLGLDSKEMSGSRIVNVNWCGEGFDTEVVCEENQKKISEIRKDYSKKIDKLTEFLDNVESVITICEDFESCSKVLVNYGILDNKLRLCESLSGCLWLK